MEFWVRRCENKCTWYTLQLWHVEVRKRGRAPYKRQRQFALVKGSSFSYMEYWKSWYSLGEKKTVTLDSEKHSTGMLVWLSKMLTQLSWLVKQHCIVFRRRAAVVGFRRGLRGGLWCRTQTGFLCCCLPATGIPWRMLLEHYRGSAKASMSTWRLTRGWLFALRSCCLAVFAACSPTCCVPGAKYDMQVAFHYKTPRPFQQLKPVRPTAGFSAGTVISPPNVLHAVCNTAQEYSRKTY